jgi:hypothetical protein
VSKLSADISPTHMKKVFAIAPADFAAGARGF